MAYRVLHVQDSPVLLVRHTWSHLSSVKSEPALFMRRTKAATPMAARLWWGRRMNDDSRARILPSSICTWGYRAQGKPDAKTTGQQH